eukprot:GEMP01042635.1.p1 GENE.GEMP01042635.1~~GEMP01042635.1.p1  ORF type:complete len:339 (+),score=51.06 GEMP01042635.1:348-1364(+)
MTAVRRPCARLGVGCLLIFSVFACSQLYLYTQCPIPPPPCVCPACPATPPTPRCPTLAHAVRAPDLAPLMTARFPTRRFSNVYFLTQRYAEKKNAVLNAERQARRAATNATSFFHTIFSFHVFPPFIMNDPRWTRHLRFLKNPRAGSHGCGYWFWKSATVHHLFSTFAVPDGSWLVYIDSDIQFSKTWQFWSNFFSRLHEDTDLLSTVLSLPEHKWTKGDVFRAFNMTIRTDVQVQGGMFMLKNTATIRAFILDWIGYTSKWHLISDERSVTPNHKEFQDARHDQSIWSLLVKTRACHHGELDVLDCDLGKPIVIDDWSVHYGNGKTNQLRWSEFRVK